MNCETFGRLDPNKPALKPPAEIVGPMRRETRPAHKQARTKWILEKLDEGYRLNELAAALGVAPNRVGAAAKAAGHVFKLRKMDGEYLDLNGTSFVTDFRDPLTDEVRVWLKRNCPKSISMGAFVASIVVDAYFDEQDRV